MSYIILDVEQGTPEWEEIRYGYVTASEIPILFEGPRAQKTGIHSAPYQKLLKSKVNRTREEISPTLQALFNFGHEFEERVKQSFIDAGKMTLTSPVIVSTRNQNILASLDIFDEENKILIECKWTSSLRKFEDFKRGIFDPKHIIQIQAQLFCTGFESAQYLMGTNEESLMFEITSDEKMHEEINKKVDIFFSEYKMELKNANLQKVD